MTQRDEWYQSRGGPKLGTTWADAWCTVVEDEKADAWIVRDSGGQEVGCASYDGTAFRLPGKGQ